MLGRVWRRHGTKILGAVSAIWSGWIAIDGLFPADKVKYALALNVVLGVLTIQRGYQNTKPPV